MSNRPRRPFPLPLLRPRRLSPLPRFPAEASEAGLLLMRLGHALHSYGTPTHRLEETLEALSATFDLEAQFLATPTSLIASVGPLEEQRSYLIRLQPGEIDLGKLAELYSLIENLRNGSMNVSEALLEASRIEDQPAPYPLILSLFAMVLSSASAAVLLGGGLRELIAAGGIGLGIGLLFEGASKIRTLGRTLLLVGALWASMAAALAEAWAPPLSPFVPMLAGLIILLPGLTLTTAMNELAHAHLVSGTARLTGAMVSFLELGFGVALGRELAALIAEPNTGGGSEALPSWIAWIAVVIAAPAFTILFRARWRHALPILLGLVVAYAGGMAGAMLLGPQLGSFLGALALGMAANAYARISKAPSALLVVPGILLIVPGSLGFRSLSALLQNDVVVGVEGAFSVVLVATALVAGLFLANLMIPSRRLL